MAHRRTVALYLSAVGALFGGCVQPSPKPSEPTVVPVTAYRAQRVDFRPSIALIGRVEPHQRVGLSIATPGRISYPERFAGGLRTGAWVEQGELLATIKNQALRFAVEEQRLALDSAEAEMENVQQGVDGGFRPAIDLRRQQTTVALARQRLLAAQAAHRALELRAPLSGSLHIRRVVAPASEVAAGTALGEIAGGGAPQVEAYAAADDLPHLALGLAVECRRPQDQLLIATGAVAAFDREVSALGTVRVLLSLTEERGLPPAGSGVEVRVLLAEQPNSLVLSEESLLYNQESVYVFALEAEGEHYRARKRQLSLGARDGDRVAVVSGLRPGELVAASGAERLSDGALAALVERSDGATDAPSER